MWVRALYDFTTLNEDELTFERGDVIEVVDKLDQHWWYAEINGERKLFPSNYVVFEDVEEELYNDTSTTVSPFTFDATPLI